MPDESSGYSLSDLCDLADVTPRTVRYYIQQGLLRSPEVAGANTRYDEGHLWRLRLIRQLQRDHLPLAEIRKRLSALSDAETRALVGGPPPAQRESAVDYIRTLLDSRGVRPMVPAALAAAPAPSMPAPVSGHGSAGRLRVSETTGPMSPDRSHWERISISPDVELHIRRPLSRDDNRRVDRLISIARQLLEEGTP